MKTYVEKLKAATLLQFDNNLQRDFIPLDGGMQPVVDEKERFDLWNQLHRTFIVNPQCKSLLLIGGSGIGKTWFTQNLVRILWEEDGVPFIPLWIRLTSIDNPQKDLLHQHLNKLRAYQLEKGVKKEDRLTDDDISLFFQEKPTLFLVLDGYDELSVEKREHQYYLENEWHQWGNLVQMVVTSRLEVLPQKRDSIFAPGADEGFTEFYIQPFNRDQLEKMVIKYCHANLPKGWTPEGYLKQLTTLYELHEFICKPFLVKVVLEALPLVFEEIAGQSEQDQQPLLKKRLTRYNLYKKFLAQHFSRESERLYRMGVGKKIEIDYHNTCPSTESRVVTLPQLLEKFTSNLARDMFNHHVSTVKWRSALQKKLPDFLASNSVAAKSEESNPEWLKSYFDDELYPHNVYLRSGSLLVSVGFHEYAFLHYSILEFYAAEQLFNGALQDSWYLTGRNLNKENLQVTPDVLKNLANRVQEESELNGKLYEIIEQSKYVPEIWRAAANAITILNCAGESFSGRDFKRIRIGGLENPNNPASGGWGADLSYSIFSGTNLSEADLRYVNFTRAHLDNALWVGACLDGVNFGCKPSISGFDFAFAGNGKSLITESLGNFKIYAWPSCKLLSKCKVARSSYEIKSFAYHPTQQQVAVVHKREEDSTYHKISLWDVGTQRRIRLLEYTAGKKVHCITYSPDGSRLAAGMRHTIQQWEVSTGNPLPGVEGLLSSMDILAYSPDGSRLAGGNCYEPSIRQWDAATGKLLCVSSGHLEGVTGIVYHPEGNRMVSRGSDHVIREWNVMTGECLAEYRGHSDYIGCVAYHPEGKRLVSASRDCIKEWNILTGALLRHYEWCLDYSNIAYSPDGGFLIFAKGDGKIRQHNLTTMPPAPLRPCDRHTNYIDAIAYHPDGTRIASSAGCYSSANNVKEWNVITGGLLHKYELNEEVARIAYSNKGRLVTGDCTTAYSLDGTRIARVQAGVIQQLNVDTGAILHSHKVPLRSVVCVAYSPDGMRIVAQMINSTYGTRPEWNPGIGTAENIKKQRRFYSKGSVYHTLQEWNAITGENLHSYSTDSSVRCLSYSNDSQRLAYGDFEGGVHERDTKTGRLLRTLKYRSVECIAYSLDNLYLAFGGSIVGIVDRVSLSKAIFEKNMYPGVRVLAWSPDSTKLATGERDHAVRLWRISKGNGQIDLTLIWQTRSFFMTTPGLNIHQVTGLREDNYKILNECASGAPLKGTPANPKFLTSEKVLAERNAQIHIPDGILPIEQPGSGSDSYHITPDDWLISIVRHKNPKVRGFSDLTGQAGGHVWLLLMGLDENRFTIFREIHFFLDTDAPTSGLLVTSGQGLISIRHCVPYDLFAELKAHTYEAKSWMIGKSQVVTLLSNVERDRVKNLQYVNTGRSPTFFGAPSFSCLTFCENHLKEIGYTVLEDKAKPWYDFMLAIPSCYLPAPPSMNDFEPTTLEQNCSLM